MRDGGATPNCQAHSSVFVLFFFFFETSFAKGLQPINATKAKSDSLIKCL